MKAKRKTRYPLRLVLPVAALAIGLAFATMQFVKALDNKVEVENHTNVVLDSVQVKVGEEQLDFGRMSAGARKEQRFKIQGDGRFEIRVAKHDGSYMKAQGAKVTKGWLGAQVKVVVHKTHIDILQAGKDP